jgi:transposase
LREVLAARGDVPDFGAFLYRFRNLAERLFNTLKHFRAIAAVSKTPRQFSRARQTRGIQNLAAL